MYRQSEKNSISFICPHNMVNFGSLTAEIGWRIWGTPANFKRFRVLASLLHRYRWTEINQTLHDVWLCPALVHYIHFWGLLARNRLLPGAKFTLRPSFTFSYIGIVTARHSISGRQQGCGIISSRDRAAILFNIGRSKCLVYWSF